MNDGCQALTEKEKQTLRLIVRGHDAKSTARHLGLSVHTINERLRDARRKLEVSSSREAARLLFSAEGNDPDFLGDKQLGEAAASPGMTDPDAPHDGDARRRRLVWTIGGTIMTLLLATLALAALQPDAAPGGAQAAPTPAADLATSPVVRVAQNWLELGDAGDWRHAYDATGSQFHKANTLQRWIDVSQKVRVPLGAVVSRRLISAEDVPAPPRGVQVVKFATTFANKSSMTETVALAREGGVWKIVGCYIE